MPPHKGDFRREMDALMQLNASRAGHDKLVRTAQYACKLVVASRPDGEAVLAQQLVGSLGSARSSHWHYY